MKKKKNSKKNYAKYKLFLDVPTESDTELSYLFFTMSTYTKEPRFQDQNTRPSLGSITHVRTLKMV